MSAGARSRTGGLSLSMMALAGVALALLLGPALVTILAAFNAGNYLQFPPDGLSTRWITEFLRSDLFRKSFVFSFQLGAQVALISTILGTAAAVAMHRVRFRGREALRALFLAPLILPGMVLGLALLSFFVVTRSGLQQSYLGLLIGHVIVTFPFVFAAVTASLARFDISLEEAARSLGAGPLRAFLDVALRVISQGILAGATFAFSASFGQFDVSLFLSATGSLPLPVALYNAIRFRTDPTIAAAGVFSITMVVVSMVLTFVIINRRSAARPQADPILAGDPRPDRPGSSVT
jgi:putative spermidine/putrescine transport system permease protein